VMLARRGDQHLAHRLEPEPSWARAATAKLERDGRRVSSVRRLSCPAARIPSLRLLTCHRTPPGPQWG
jgi:hypothetical protein